MAGLRIPLHAVAARAVRGRDRRRDAAGCLAECCAGAHGGLPGHAEPVSGTCLPVDAASGRRVDCPQPFYCGGRLPAWPLHCVRHRADELGVVRLLPRADGLCGREGANAVFLRALDEVRLPAAVAVLSIFVNYGLNWAAVRGLGWGHAGLALATASVATINFIVLFLAMRRRADGLHGRRIFEGLLKIGTATATMAGVVWFVSGLIRGWLGDGFAGAASTWPSRRRWAWGCFTASAACCGWTSSSWRETPFWDGSGRGERDSGRSVRAKIGRSLTPPHGFSPSAT
ncbi:MAG: lipid II flippase MurJ [Bryobacterales bacterium]